MAKRKDQRQEAYEAGERNLFPGQAWVQALGRGLQRELAGSDMGTPFGQALREELGSLGYENMLREQYPEDYARGRMATSEFFGPEVMTPGLMRAGIRPRFPLQGEVLPPGRVAPGAAPRRGGPTIEGRPTGPGVGGPAEKGRVAGPPARMSLPGEMRGPVDPGTSYRPMSPFERNTANLAMQRFGVYNPEMAVTDMQRYGAVGPRRMAEGPVNGFEQNAVAAMRGARPAPGYASPTYAQPSYWEEGGQGFRPSIDDYVDVNVVRNEPRYYSQSAEDFVSEQMRAGNRGIMRHPYYGDVRAPRPPYGEVLPGDRNPILEMGRPGVNRRPVAAPVAPVEGPSMRAPYGEGGEGNGYFAGLPNPGIQPRAMPGRPGLPVMAEGRGVAGAGERGMMPAGGREMLPPGVSYAGAEEMARLGYSPRMPAGAGGRAMVPTEIPGEFSEVYGIGGPSAEAGKYRMPPMSGPTVAPGTIGGAGPRMAAAGGGGGGFPYGKAAAAGAIPLAAFYAWQNRERPDNPLAGQPDASALAGPAASANGQMSPVAEMYGYRNPAEDAFIRNYMQGISNPFPDQGGPVREFEYVGEEEPAIMPLPAEGGARRGGAAKAGKAKAKGTPTPPTRPAEYSQQRGGFEPNFNYNVTAALDRIFGQNQAEAGRKYQQDVEEYQRKYGPIYY